MPPKRRSTGPNRSSAAKKAKTTKGATAAAAAATPPPPPSPSPPPAKTFEPPRSKRWAAVSASANAEADYRMVWKDEKKAYSYITLCTAPHKLPDSDDDEDGDNSDDDEEEEESEESEVETEDDGAERLATGCGRKGCVCFKPLSLNPEHPWVISWAGYRKFINQDLHFCVRDPDVFGMYVYNDFAGYGSLEIMQNLFLDFEEAGKEKRGGDGGWREQWAICEAVAYWLSGHSGLVFTRSDDADQIWATTALVGRMFLAMLAKLDELGLVGDATAVRSLGCTMAAYMELAADLRNGNFLEDIGGRPPGTFEPEHFDDGILVYANRRGVTLSGPARIEELMAEADGDVPLPTKGTKDPWGWKAAFTKYRKLCSKIGGDYYDITTMSAAQRKQASFANKDPFTKKDIENIKNGMIIHLG